MQLNHTDGFSRRLALSVLVAIGLVVASCGNSGDDTADSDENPSTTETGGSDATGDEEFVSIEGVPGVTDDEIRYAGFGTFAESNPLGTCVMQCMAEGVEAYFAYRNSEGGVHGRELVLDDPVNDELTKNQEKALEIVSAGEHFGAFSATQVASGWQDITGAGMPLYVWNIHPVETQDEAVFGNAPTICIECTQRNAVWAGQQIGAENFAVFGYGVSENSKLSAQTSRAAIEQHADETGQEVVVFDDNLDFGLPNGIAPQVSAMVENDVDMVLSSIDLNGQKTLAQEMERQGLGDVPIFHPNTYNQDFVAEAGDLFVGDFVTVGFLPFEAEAEGTGQAAFREWMGELGHEISEVAMVGWIVADAAYQGLVAAGPDFDQQKVIDATNQITDFTADGLVPPIDWTTGHTPPTPDDRITNGSERTCTAMVRVNESAEFEIYGGTPEKPWVCFANDDLSVLEPEFVSFG
ncbi:MAG: ABC transporter substrate-binding protein [Acidimicrobiales bacterium]|nr:ABC transporter substrate-binding protein [Acidimicrobiales bacterium]